MNKSFFQTAEKLNKEHRRTRRWHKVITVMAAIVVFCTTYALILPAITWERHLLCDTKEHTHTTACYAEVVVTPEARELTCSVPEHVHGDSCYEEVTTYVCGLEASDEHQHTADCMQVERVLTCEQSEHTHGDSCYHITPAVMERQLVCTKPEHVHTDACFDAPPSSDSGYYCGYAEHTHDKSCYFDDGALRCTMKEHTHTLSCQIDKTADLETADGWERTFADAKLGDNWAQNVLTIADTQLGYTESAKNFVIDDEKTGAVRGYSRYGAWYGDPYGDWCAMFASFCIDYAGVKDFPLDSNCGTWIEALSDENCLLYHPTGSYLESYMPQPGDLIFFDWDAQKQTAADETAAEESPAEIEATEIELTEAEKAEAEAKLIEQATHDVDHVGLVYELIEATETKPAQIKTIEGNNGNVVAYHTYDLDDVQILGYGRLPENPDYLEFHEITSDPASDGAAVTISGNLPKDAKATIETANLSENELNTYIGEETAAAINSYIAYDIKIMVGETEWQPDDSVSVQIKHPNLEVKNSDCLAAAHVNDVTHTASEVEKPVGTDDAISFTTGGFSTYIFYTFTVDFHYGEAVFSIEGRTEITLSELFAELGITRSVADVVEVTFSDESLVKVTKTDTDWILTSLEPFSTNETLTIVFNDGEVYVLGVTDAQADWGWQKVTSIAAGDLVIVQLNSNNNFYLTNETMANNSGLVLKNGSINDATIWTVVNDNNALRLRSDKDGRRGDMVIEQSKAYLGSGNRAIPSYDSANNCWVLARGNLYLNQFGGGNSTQAAGYGTGASDPNSRWNILKLTPASLTAINGTAGNNDEGYDKLFDNDPGTKYCVNPDNNKITVTFKTASGNPLTANAYSLTTANDNDPYGRLPSGWTLFGSNDNKNWTQISRITSPGMNAVNYTGYAYNIDSPVAYTYYKIEFNATSLIQFSDLKLYGTETVANGTVRDGNNYKFDVYLQRVDDYGDRVGEPVKIGTQTADYTRTRDNNPIVPSAIFNEKRPDNGVYVNAYYGTASTKDKDGVTKVYRYSDNNNRYLGIVCDNGQTTLNNYLNASSEKALYIEYRVNGGGGGGGGGDDVVKPEYPAYIDPSGAKTGNTNIDDVKGTYWSDPATSKLESLFDDHTPDDGKVMTDKSVIYGDDDYNAFETYDPNTFGVTLSALGQKYILNREMKVQVPMDVVFVLDTSGSMIDSKYNGSTNAYTMIQSLNSIMKTVLDANKDNRVGVVCFSGQSEKLLDLGRYKAPNDEFFNAEPWKNAGEDDKHNSFGPSDLITYENGHQVSNKGSYTKGWWGTFTQHGIAQGAQEFLDVAEDDTTVTRTVETTVDGTKIQATYTATRRPVIILLSDGDPTYCTSDYNNVLDTDHMTMYGNGQATTSTNNQGILGYYTILSGEYYKRQIAKHYGTDAYFYSIGLGINATGTNSYSNSVTGDDYKRAVLNPSAGNINVIGSCTDVQNTRHTHSDNTCHELNQLLNSTYNKSTVTVGSVSNPATYGEAKATQSNVPVKSNPYQSSGYAYADDSFFTTQATIAELTKAFEDAVSFSKNIPVYGFILRNNTAVTVTDPIGEGMEIKSEPILRYGGENHSPVSHETQGNITTYHYVGTYTATDGSGQTADLSLITAEVHTDANGNQTVKLIVPDTQLPAYSPYLKNDGAPRFYYESLPVRLIYQVGLTEQAQADVTALAEFGGTKTYYTNQWSDSANAYATFSPTSKNPYYQDDQYDKAPVNKAENTTGTAKTSRDFSPDSDEHNVGQLLGNNGKLTFSYDIPPQKLTLYKVDMKGNKIATDEATFELYDNADLTNPKTYTTVDGVLTIPDLTAGKSYWLVEAESPDGYYRVEAPQEFKVNAKGQVVGIDTDIAHFQWDNDNQVLKIYNTDGYELPVSGGSGLIPIYASGILLMAGALVYGYSMRRKRERRQSN